MKGLRMVLTPFAPDQSGAVSVLYRLGGMIVIIDAGGCTGNVCGFDEPRWHETKAAVFSAGLRDMDAILGRDSLLVSKIAVAAERIDAKFIALIGTPVPATIATDYKALRRMLEKKVDLPILCVPTDGMRLYDSGEAAAYKELFAAFKEDGEGGVDGKELVLGATPLTYGKAHVDITLEDVKSISGRKIIAASSSGIEAAKMTDADYEIKNSIAEELIARERIEGKVLICHDEVFGKTLRDNGIDCDIATFFKLHDEIRKDGDTELVEEDDFTALAESGKYDVIVADSCLQKLAKNYKGKWIDAPFFALSGRQ